jgi:hypothetical protein
LAADHYRSGSADVGVPLFDTEAISLTTLDIRTVREMLHDVDDNARQLLRDVDGDDAGRLLHGWPGLVASAVGVWSSLPGQYPGPGVLERDEPITRLASPAEAITTTLRRREWPPAEEPDRRLAQMATPSGTPAT